MTEQEAIEALKMDNALMCFDAITGIDIPYEFLNSTNKAVYDANLIAIEALEKQIPKKPEVSDEYHHFRCCPTCKIIFDADVEYYLKYGEWTYCGHCGQKIEWGE